MNDEKDNPKLDLRNPAALGAFLKGDIGNAMVASTPGGIEKQEALGQQAFLNSEILPIELQNVTKVELETLGFVFGRTVDDLFQQAKLPVGWTKHSDNHAMWSSLQDESGKKRASIFYKAAFYDRKAFLFWKTEEETKHG